MFTFADYTYPEQRGKILDAQEEIAWQLLKIADQHGEKEAFARTLDRLMHEVVWFATLIEPTKTGKYWRQRYISRGAYDFFQAYNGAHKKGLGKAKSLVATGAPRGSISSYLQHEHVYPCAVLQAEIYRAKQRTEVRAILERAAACVVTRAEHKRLVADAKGWNVTSVPIRPSRSGIA